MPRSLLNTAGSNVLAVRVNNSGSNSRWYSGSGLHRPVRLLTYSKTHIAPVHAGGGWRQVMVSNSYEPALVRFLRAHRFANNTHRFANNR